MNNRILIALPLAAVLSLPALAQTTTTSQPANTPAASTDTATGKAPLAPPSREGFWGRVNPFARKSYVKRQTEPIRDRVNELDDLTAANSKNIKDTDARAQAGIKMASRQGRCSRSARRRRRQQGHRRAATAQQATTRIQNVETVVSNIDQYKASNQTEILFRPGQTMLSKPAKDALDEMADHGERPARLHHRSAGILLRARARRRSSTRRRWPSRWCVIWCSTTRFRSIASTSSAWAMLLSPRMTR
jgi:hypothetical protein